MNEVVIVDYGVGNLFSLGRAVEHMGGTPRICLDPEGLRRADRAILPGVGAFGDGLANLRASGMDEALKEYGESGKPLLGICLGMQLLFDSGEEFGTHRGLGLIPGRVVAIPRCTIDGNRQKIPHIGWSALAEPQPCCWRGTILETTQPGTAVYFIHSYSAVPAVDDDVLALCGYGGHPIIAAVRHNGTVGCQFHPERSGRAGLAIIQRFLAT